MSVFHENKQTKKPQPIISERLGMSVVFMNGTEMSPDTGNF